jgi:hypothetical protein
MLALAFLQVAAAQRGHRQYLVDSFPGHQRNMITTAPSTALHLIGLTAVWAQPSHSDGYDLRWSRWHKGNPEPRPANPLPATTWRLRRASTSASLNFYSPLLPSTPKGHKSSMMVGH